MPARPRRRAVGPRGAWPPTGAPTPEREPTAGTEPVGSDPDHDARLIEERPPHHDQGV